MYIYITDKNQLNISVFISLSFKNKDSNAPKKRHLCDTVSEIFHSNAVLWMLPRRNTRMWCKVAASNASNIDQNTTYCASPRKSAGAVGDEGQYSAEAVD